MTDAVLIEDRGPVRAVILNRPDRHNAFDDALIAELTAAFQDAAADPLVRIVTLESTGKSFSAGADLGWMRRMAEYDRTQNLADAMALAALLATIDACPKPVIGVAQGPAYGGGVGLLACCDLVVAADTANFRLSEVRLGLIPATIGPYVVRAIGARAARRLFLTAEIFTAARALMLGLVSELVEPDHLLAARDRLAATLLDNGPVAMAAAKELVREIADRPIDAALRQWTAERIADIRAGDEGREGLRAFLDKRPPAWIPPSA